VIGVRQRICVVTIVNLLVGIDVAALGAEQSLFDWGGLAL
jgi:hypothetical protein